jgi:2-dehydropantoate 2-reductase
VREQGDELRTIIIGAGAVGLALGSCLHADGHPVRYLVRDGPSPHPLETHGLVRSGLFGEARVAPEAIEILRSPAQLAEQPVDFVLVCTKTTATAEVAEQLGAVWSELRGEPAIVLCQNGWGNAECFAERIPRDRVFSARVITGFRRHDAHAVEVTVHADAIHMGSLFGADPSILAPLCAAIARGGLPCEVTQEIARDLWAKVLYNCLLNPLGALVGVPYGELGKRESTRSIMERIAREIFAVLRASGEQTHWQSAESYLESFYGELLPPTAGHESSMLQDLRAGRPTEVDAISGAVANLGRAHGVDTPVNLALCQLVHVAELRGGEGVSLAGLTAS